MRQRLMKVARAGLMAGFKYGLRSKGVGTARLQQYRQQLARALGKRKSASLSLFLALNGIEPTHEATVEPVVAWALAVWDRTADRGTNGPGLEDTDGPQSAGQALQSCWSSWGGYPGG